MELFTFYIYILLTLGLSRLDKSSVKKCTFKLSYVSFTKVTFPVLKIQ